MRTRAAAKLIGWQGLTLNVPESWDLTGFSGNDATGYVRIDDSEEQAVEVKWSTTAKGRPDDLGPPTRRTVFIENLRRTARKKKLSFESTEPSAYKPVERPDRSSAPFTWTGDRKAFGAVWFCQTCRRVVIAQVLGAPSGRGKLSSVAEDVLGSLQCHGDDPAWRTWALYDLETQIPSEYALESQQLMNVYLRLSFVGHKTARLTVEQWALANVARRDAYLDVWLAANTKGEMNDATYTAEEGEMQGHPALMLKGHMGIGFGLAKAVRQVVRFQRPATQFGGVAWECGVSNKLYLVQSLRPGNVKDMSLEVSQRTICHRDEEDAVVGKENIG